MQYETSRSSAGWRGRAVAGPAGKLNALNRALWSAIPAAVAELDSDPDVRVIVLAGRGKAFCAGIDLVDHAPAMAGGGSLSGRGDSAVGRRRALLDDVGRYQDTCSSFANATKPVIAAVHGPCLGAGMDLITACDIRLASADATFSVRETKIAMVADVGSCSDCPASWATATPANSSSPDGTSTRRVRSPSGS